MNADELRAAAAEACERIRDLSGDIADTLSGSHGPGDPFTYRGTLLHDLLDAALVVKKAYLVEHPADDGEAVTTQWLLSVGFRPDKFGCPTRGALHVQPPRMVAGSAHVQGYACVRSYPLPYPETRGAVRRLAAALGIPLAESPQHKE